MSPTKPEPLTFLIPGQERRPETGRSRGGRIAPGLSAEWSIGTVKQSVSVGVGRAGGVVPVQAVPGEDVVVLEIANGPDLILHPETARDLMLAQHPPTSGRGAAEGNGAGAGSITVPIALGWQGLEDPAVARGVGGLLGRVLLSAVHVVTGVGTKWAAAEIAEKVDAQVDAGVYRLSREALPPLKGSGVPGVEHGADGKPLLVLIHGTFSNTGGTFGKLWTAHPQLVGTLFQHYEDRVYGLDHPTLGQSPIANAITLAESLPPGARLHLVTHSRGGLVAEVLARLSAHPELSAEELEFFQGDAYDDQRQELKRLATLLEDKDIRVERVVRVACPARGTLLASKRLDAYLSVFKWSLQLAGIPVAPVLLDLMAQVARQRTDPGFLPGLAAQIPDSPLIQWLHAAENPLGGELRVVAGDGEGDSITSWLKTLVSDAFYWTDNDLVVQTRSMYGGAPRTHAATFLLDRGAKVSHFTYFSNPRTAEAIVDALRDDEPRGFGTIGPRSLAGESSSGSRAALRAQASTIPPGEKPAVFLLPGILGSNLKIGRQRIWLGWRLINGLMRLAYMPPRPDGVEPDGPLDSVYDRLGDFLSRSHEVIEFGYDWRKPIEQVAQLLADEVEKALDVRGSNGQSVRLLAHSMGGIVARTMQIERPEVWERMMSRPGGRLLMLGTPNAGSWTPMQVLSGDDTFGNLLAIFGAPFHDRQARELMARFPGFLQLQAALLDGTPDLSRHETWLRLAEEDVRLLRQRSWWHHLELQLRAYEWGVPPQEVLDQAKGLRQRLDEQAMQGFGGTKDSIVMVAGRAPFTPDGFETGADGLVYLDVRDGGDGRVTLKSLRLEGVRVWQLDSDHGSLPERKEAFEAYQELLEKGTTTRLKPLLPPTRGAAEQQPISHVRSRPSRARPASRPPETSGELLSAASTGPVAVGRPDQVPLRITVHNGDLTFVREPLLIGHYRSSRLTGTESVMDRVIGKLLSEALKVGDYADLPGTYATFPNAQPPRHNPWQLPRPEAVIVVGLGPEGGLRSSDLIETVRKGVVGWARVEARRPGGVPALFDLAATLIGSGGKGISTGQSARLIAQGVRDANRRLAEADLPRVGHLHLIELYLDRATEAWRALRILMEGASAEYLVTDTIEIGTAALTRPPDLGYRGADYDFLSAVTPEHGGEGLIEYTLDTKRARSEVRAQATQSKLIRAMVEEASNDANSDPQIGNTLCRLLLPLDLDPFVGGTSELVIELDGGTAGIPWELFDADSPSGRETTPWSIRSKLVRKLRTADFRQQVREADLDAGALVIGEPLADREIYPELPGAREEAMAVARCLRGPHGLGSERVHLLVGSDTEPGPDAQTVLNALLSRDTSWRIVHIAGHGEPATVVESTSPQPGQPPQKYGGVVLSNKTFLGPREIRSMRLVPELVFVNCCHLGAFRPEQLLTPAQRELGRPYDRAMFAYGVAEELIKIGVRCVVAAGWAVNDDAAKAFAETFYGALLRNERFGDAVAQAREAARALGGNTWAAYQCYGDPDWMLQRATGDPQRPAGLDAARGIEPAEEFAGVASPPGLTLALESLSVGSRFQGKPAESQRTKIRYLEERFGQLWGDLGSVAEGFAEAWDAAGDQHKAIEWYRRALAAGDGSASLRATEELGKLLVHQGEAELIGSATADSGKTRKRARAKPKVSGNGAAAESIKHARSAVEEGIGRLEKVLALEPNMERESLLGLAYKRLAMIAAAQGDTKAETMAIAEMEQHYARAEELGRKGRLADRYYPLMNQLAAKLVLGLRREDMKGWEEKELAAARRLIEEKIREDPDFWSVVSKVDLRLIEAVARQRLADERAAIEAEYQDIYRRVSKTRLTEAVYDQARFVLGKYSQGAPPKERAAAEAMLQVLGRD